MPSTLPVRRFLAGTLTAALAGTAVLGAGSPAAAERGSAEQDRRLVSYTVRAGETPSELAVRFHAWTDELIEHNRLRGGVLREGQRIEIPVVVSAAREARHSAGKRSERAPGKQGAGKGRLQHERSLPAPPRGQVRRTIVRQARLAKVDPQLALAVAWQESGWQMNVISSAGALGAMQVLPTTATWMQDYAGHRLRPRTLRGNAITGTTLLRVLGDNTRSPRHQIGAYYQGLGALEEHGLYDESRPYVANVLALKRRLERGVPLY